MVKPLIVQKERAEVGRLQNQLKTQREKVKQLEADKARLQSQLRHSETRQRLETVHAVLISVDSTYQLISASPNIDTYTGHNSKQVIGRSLLDFIHETEVRPFEALCGKMGLKPSQTMRLRLGTPAKGYRWMRVGVSPLLKGARHVGFKCIFVDIHMVHQAHNVPSGTVNKYRDTIECLQEGYFETDLSGQFSFCNKALLDITGYCADEIIGKTFRDIASLHTARAMMALFGKVYKSGKNIKRCSHEVFHKLGHTLKVEYSVGLIKSRDGNPIGFQGVLSDVTELVRSLEKREQQNALVSQSRKMNALGTLAGGLAHGFNNVLMAIQGNLSLIRMNLSDNHPMQEKLERINQSTEKGSRLAREILSFAKVGKFVVMPTNMNKIIMSTHRMFVRTQPNLNVHEHLNEKLWRTQVDRVQIGQALLSLYGNAVKAMPDGGDLHLKSENVILDETDTRPYEAKPGRYIKISVTDSGIGLGDKAKERIFEPFYCAYHPMRYDGLGLAAAYGTIKSHQGIINVHSQEGEGATFSLYLPAMPEQTPNQNQAGEKAQKTETILLVDDDELCSQTGREILERRGYRVMIAQNGQEAIELYAKFHDQIQLVLLDVILPDLDGDLIFQKLKKYNPNPTVIVVSGYNVNKQVSTLLNQGCIDFIQKPFMNETLSNKVRAALDHTSVPPAIAQLIS